MKIGNPSNYYVQVFRDAWDESPQTAPLYDGIFTVALNVSVHVQFVPDVSDLEPPWPPNEVAPDAEFTTPGQVRWYALYTSGYSVTPNARLADRTEQAGPYDGRPATVFYVAPAEYAVFADELAALAEQGSGATPHLRRDDLLDTSVIRFIDDRVLNSPLLKTVFAEAVGRGPRP